MENAEALKEIRINLYICMDHADWVLIGGTILQDPLEELPLPFLFST
jgi:hypothetical protein